MSSSSALSVRAKSARGRVKRGKFRSAVLVTVALLATGCGFRPLYGDPGGARASTAEQMAAIRILPLRDRLGQQMHNMLRDRLNPRGQPRDPAYVLAVKLSEVREELGIRKDETATRANLTLYANYTLRAASGDKILFTGQSSSVNSFNILSNQFASLFSESDAQTRALRELSDDIRTRLGLYFARAREDARL